MIRSCFVPIKTIFLSFVIFSFSCVSFSLTSSLSLSFSFLFFLRFVCLMAYHPLWIIQSQCYFRRSVTILLIALRRLGVQAFPEDINPKVNIIAWVEFELAYCNIRVPHVSHYSRGVQNLRSLLFYCDFSPLFPFLFTFLFCL